MRWFISSSYPAALATRDDLMLEVTYAQQRRIDSNWVSAPARRASPLDQFKVGSRAGSMHLLTYRAREQTHACQHPPLRSA